MAVDRVWQEVSVVGAGGFDEYGVVVAVVVVEVHGGLKGMYFDLGDCGDYRVHREVQAPSKLWPRRRRAVVSPSD